MWRKKNTGKDRPEVFAGVRRGQLPARLAIGGAVLLAALGTSVLVLASGADSSKAKKATTDLFAVVNSDGTLARGSAVSSARVLPTGGYEVIFDADMSRCAYVASLGLESPGNTVPGEIQTVNRSGNANGVFVTTYDSSGTPTDRGFHLTVACSASSKAKKPTGDLFAVVNSDGTLARGSAVSSARVLPTGGYEVIFDADMSRCAYVASLGLESPGNTVPGEIQTVNRSGNANGVFVTTYDSSGTPTDRGFHLTVAC